MRSNYNNFIMINKDHNNFIMINEEFIEKMRLE